MNDVNVNLSEQEQVRLHYLQIQNVSLSVMTNMDGMMKVYSTTKADATLKLLTLIKNQNQIFTMQSNVTHY